MNALAPASIPPAVFVDASALVISAYLLRCQPSDPMPDATRRAIELARAREVPVVLTLGTRFVIAERPEFWRDFIREHVDVVAMNEEEGAALTGADDPLLACDRAPRAGRPGAVHRRPDRPVPGRAHRRRGQARDPAIRSCPGAIPEFNRHEFSRPMRRADCAQPIKVYAHIAPYHGGPRAHHQHQRRRRRGAGGAAPTTWRPTATTRPGCPTRRSTSAGS
jgi:inosine kinase